MTQRPTDPFPSLVCLVKQANLGPCPTSNLYGALTFRLRPSHAVERWVAGRALWTAR